MGWPLMRTLLFNVMISKISGFFLGGREEILLHMKNDQHLEIYTFPLEKSVISL